MPNIKHPHPRPVGSTRSQGLDNLAPYITTATIPRTMCAHVHVDHRWPNPSRGCLEKWGWMRDNGRQLREARLRDGRDRVGVFVRRVECGLVALGFVQCFLPNFF